MTSLQVTTQGPGTDAPFQAKYPGKPAAREQRPHRLVFSLEQRETPHQGKICSALFLEPAPRTLSSRNSLEALQDPELPAPNLLRRQQRLKTAPCWGQGEHPSLVAGCNRDTALRPTLFSLSHLQRPESLQRGDGRWLKAGGHSSSHRSVCQAQLTNR